jgi:hypothetical protein
VSWQSPLSILVPLLLCPILASLPLGDALLEELFAGVGDSVAFGDVGSHGFDLADLFVLVELGEGFVLVDVEDQVGEGPQGGS